MTWPMGLARRPDATRSRYWSPLSTMPPPVPPSVNAGRMTAGRPISRAPRSAACRSPAWHPRRSPTAGTAGRCARAASGSARGPPPSRWPRAACPADGHRAVRSTPARATSTARLSAVWPPRPAQDAVGLLALEDALDRRRPSAARGRPTSATPGSVMIVAGLELSRMVRTPSSRSARQACVPA